MLFYIQVTHLRRLGWQSAHGDLRRIDAQGEQCAERRSHGGAKESEQQGLYHKHEHDLPPPHADGPESTDLPGALTHCHGHGVDDADDDDDQEDGHEKEAQTIERADGPLQKRDLVFPDGEVELLAGPVLSLHGLELRPEG